MHLLCPHCHGPIELVKVTPNEEFTCPSCGSSFHLATGSTAAGTTQAGRSLGRFAVLDTVGQGAFGTVYKARDPELDRVVALKVPRAGNLAGPQELERFLREARSAAQLRHPSIVSVHEVGTADGLPYLVSDFVQGVTLSEQLKMRRPTQREAAELIATVAEAVQYAHEQGVVHRDLKPSNIMVDGEGRPFVMDFGLAKRDAGEITMTIDGQILGTPAYMSPEQARGEAHAVDGRSDVYSLGVILYELLTGELPFRGTKRMLLHQVLHDEPRAPRRLNDTIARDLETVCLKAMAKEPGRRYATAGELAADLRRWLTGEPVRARPVGRLERGWRWCKRNPALAAAFTTVLIVFAAGATVSTVLAIRANDARGQAEREAENTRKKEEELRESNDRLLTSVARSLVRPLAVQVKSYDRSPPLSDPEIETLWELASTPEEQLRLRFFEEALNGSVPTRQLKDRAEYTLQAAVGLDASRRTRVKQLLFSKMGDGATPREQQRDVALTLSHLGVLDRAVAGTVAQTLTRALGEAKDPSELRELVEGLSALAPALDPREASDICGQAAALLATAIGKRTDEHALRELFRGLSVVVSRLGPADAAPVAATLSKIMGGTGNEYVSVQSLSAVLRRLGTKEALATVIRAMRETTDPRAWRGLAQCVLAMAARLDTKEAASAAATLIQSMSRTTDSFNLLPLAQALSAVAARLDPGEAAETAASLTQAMGMTTNPYTSSYLAQGLAAVAARLDRKEAATVSATTAASLARAMSETSDSSALQSLARGLSALAARLDPGDAAETAASLTRAMGMTTNPTTWWTMARGLAAVAARLDPKAAASAAASLAQTMSRTTDQHALQELAAGLSAVAMRLAPEEALAFLTRAMDMTTDPFALRELAQGLAAVAARLDPKEASAVCGRATVILTRAIGKSRNQAVSVSLLKGLSAVAARLHSVDAAETAASLARAMSETTDPSVLRELAQGLSAVAGRLDPKEASAVCGRASATLLQAMSKKIGSYPSGEFAQGLSALATHLEPKEALATLARAMHETTDPRARMELVRGLSAVAARLDSKEASAVCGRASAALLQVMSKTTDESSLQYLAQSLSAVAERLEPGVAASAAATLTQAMSKTNTPSTWSVLARSLSNVLSCEDSPRRSQRVRAVTGTVGLLSDLGTLLEAPVLASSALEPLPHSLPAQTLVELLKHPLCVGAARRIVLAELSRHYNRPFADQWEFVRYVHEQKLDLDLTTPPQRPQMPAAGG